MLSGSFNHMKLYKQLCKAVTARYNADTEEELTNAEDYLTHLAEIILYSIKDNDRKELLS